MKISIVISAYNAEAYIEKCLNSILNQANQEVELIVVDDGSIDQTAEIVKAYQKQEDVEIRLIQQVNQGVQAARQVGMEACSGDYLLWMDSDDWLESQALSRLIQVVHKYPSDMICFNYQCVTCDGDVSSSLLHLEAVSDQTLIQCLLTGKLNGALWNKLIKKDFLIRNNITLPKNLYYGEDLASLVLISTFKPTVFVLNDVLYNYYLRPNSVSNSKQSAIYRLPESLNYVELLLSSSGEYTKELELFFYLHLYYYRVILETNSQVKQYFKSIWERKQISMIKNPLFYDFLMRLPLKQKLKWIIFFIRK